jgi:hypothetical protein
VAVSKNFLAEAYGAVLGHSPRGSAAGKVRQHLAVILKGAVRLEESGFHLHILSMRIDSPGQIGMKDPLLPGL